MIIRLLLAGVTAFAVSLPALAVVPGTPSAAVTVAALGDLAAFRSIATDTLTLADKGQIAAAQKRGTDLETAWDEAEDKLKPTDPTRWRVVDKAIDHVLNELRSAQPKQPGISAALKDLLTTMDKGGAA